MKNMMLAAVAALAVAVPSAQADRVRGDTAALNQFRAEQGLAPLRWSRKLQKAAEAHADDMMSNGYFAHTSPTGSTLTKRLKRVRYHRPCFGAENIAMGLTRVDEVIAGFAGSPRHRRHMVNPQAQEFGLARAGDKIWVMVLGASRC